jgi:hypothetical protein
LLTDTDRSDVGSTPQGIHATPAELREIVKDAYVYGSATSLHGAA